MKKFLVILACLAVVHAECEAEKKFKGVLQGILKATGKENYEMGEKAKCIQNELFNTRHEELAGKMKEFVGFYEKFAERRDEIIADPTKIDIEKFHQVCPVVQGKIAGIIEVVNGAIQFCRGDKAESHPFLPALVEKWFGWVCTFNKDQIVTMMGRRGNECYVGKRDIMKHCFLDNFDVDDLENVGFCGLKYEKIFSCTQEIFEICSPNEEVNLSQFFLNFFKEQCGSSQDVNTV